MEQFRVFEAEEKAIFENEFSRQETLQKSSQGTHANINKPSKDAIRLSKKAIFMEFATKEIKKRTKRQIQHFSSEFHGVPDFQFPEPFCQSEDIEQLCDANYPYRTLSGFCNNLNRSELGSHTITLRRLLPSEYDDGVARPRSVGVLHTPLPNVRLISNVVHQGNSGNRSRR